MRQWSTLIQTKEVGLWRFLLNNQNDIGESSAKPCWDLLEGAFYQAIEIFRPHE
jgi:hypothetical protein